jgi:membrane protein DedA with SNARE-associated domain
MIAYCAGKNGGRPFVEKYGKYVLIRRKDLDKADSWFKRHSDATVFVSHLFPVIRTFISFPAGMAKYSLAGLLSTRSLDHYHGVLPLRMLVRCLEVSGAPS